MRLARRRPCRRSVRARQQRARDGHAARLDRGRRSSTAPASPTPPSTAITAWTYNDLELMRPYVEALVEAPLDDAIRDRVRRRRRSARIDLAAIRELTKDLSLRGDFDTFRKRAAILHTDARCLGAVPGGRPPPPVRQSQRRAGRAKKRAARRREELRRPRRAFRADEPALGFRDGHARRRCRRTPGAIRSSREWYRAIGAYFASERNFADALAHFERARAVVPDDPLVLYGEACLQETLGAPRIQNYVRVTTLPNGLVIRGVSIAADASAPRRSACCEARSPPIRVSSRRNLRLGRVLTQLQTLRRGAPLFARGDRRIARSTR